jgi:hypothetical protein
VTQRLFVLSAISIAESRSLDVKMPGRDPRWVQRPGSSKDRRQ